jgi:hypothetical protein
MFRRLVGRVASHPGASWSCIGAGESCFIPTRRRCTTTCRKVAEVEMAPTLGHEREVAEACWRGGFPVLQPGPAGPFEQVRGFDYAMVRCNVLSFWSSGQGRFAMRVQASMVRTAQTLPRTWRLQADGRAGWTAPGLREHSAGASSARCRGTGGNAGPASCPGTRPSSGGRRWAAATRLGTGSPGDVTARPCGGLCSPPTRTCAASTGNWRCATPLCGMRFVVPEIGKQGNGEVIEEMKIMDHFIPCPARSRKGRSRNASRCSAPGGDTGPR